MQPQEFLPSQVKSEVGSEVGSENAVMTQLRGIAKAAQGACNLPERTGQAPRPCPAGPEAPRTTGRTKTSGKPGQQGPAVPWPALEHLDEVHWLSSQHVAHLARMAKAFEQIGLAAAARDFRESAAAWDRLLGEIEETRPPWSPAPASARTQQGAQADMYRATSSTASAPK